MIYFIVPKSGLYGYIAVIYVSTMLNAFLSIRRLLVVSKNKIQFLSDIVSPFVLALTAALFSKSFAGVCLALQNDTFSLDILMSLSVIILCVMIVVSKGNIYKTFKTAFSLLLPQGRKRNFTSKRCIKIP